MAALVLACGGARADPITRAREACLAEPPLDTTLTRRGPVYRWCEVEQIARPVRSPAPQFPQAGGCTRNVAAQVVVGPDGRTEVDASRVLESPGPEYAAAMLAALAEWEWAPAARGGVPVRQATIVVYSATAPCR